MATKQATVVKWCRKGILSAVANNGGPPPPWEGGTPPTQLGGMGERR